VYACSQAPVPVERGYRREWPRERGEAEVNAYNDVAEDLGRRSTALLHQVPSSG
jgi:hypothetical protein